jgi:hypothetical protein
LNKALSEKHKVEAQRIADGVYELMREEKATITLNANQTNEAQRAYYERKQKLSESSLITAKYQQELEEYRRKKAEAELKAAQEDILKLKQDLLSAQSKPQRSGFLSLLTGGSEENASSVFTPSSPTLFAPASPITPQGKIIPKGLTGIAKFIGKYKNENYFCAVRLLFNTESNLNQFKQLLLARDTISEECNFTIALQPSAKLWLEVKFMNCESSYKAIENFRLTGILLMKELEKIVDITDVLQMFTDFNSNEIKEEDLPDLVKSTLTTSMAIQ